MLSIQAARGTGITLDVLGSHDALWALAIHMGRGTSADPDGARCTTRSCPASAKQFLNADAKFSIFSLPVCQFVLPGEFLLGAEANELPRYRGVPPTLQEPRLAACADGHEAVFRYVPARRDAQLMSRCLQRRDVDVVPGIAAYQKLNALARVHPVQPSHEYAVAVEDVDLDHRRVALVVEVHLAMSPGVQVVSVARRPEGMDMKTLPLIISIPSIGPNPSCSVKGLKVSGKGRPDTGISSTVSLAVQIGLPPQMPVAQAQVLAAMSRSPLTVLCATHCAYPTARAWPCRAAP